MTKEKCSVLINLESALLGIKDLRVATTGELLWDDKHDALRWEIGELLCRATAIIHTDCK